MGKLEKSSEKLRFVHHESHMEWPKCEFGTPKVGVEHLNAYTTERQGVYTGCKKKQLQNFGESFLAHHHQQQQTILLKGRSFTANSGTKAAVLPKDRSSSANSGTKVAVLLGMDRCGSFPLLSAPYYLFSIWTDLKRSGKIQGRQRWGEESGFG